MVPYCPEMKMKAKTVYLLGAIFFGLLSLFCGIMFWEQGSEWLVPETFTLVGCWFCLKWYKWEKKTEPVYIPHRVRTNDALRFLDTEGKNWCTKYNHKIDYELVHEICEDIHPKGCANCENSTHYTFSHDSKWSWGGRGVGKRRNENG